MVACTLNGITFLVGLTLPHLILVLTAVWAFAAMPRRRSYFNAVPGSLTDEKLRRQNRDQCFRAHKLPPPPPPPVPSPKVVRPLCRPWADLVDEECDTPAICDFCCQSDVLIHPLQNDRILDLLDKSLHIIAKQTESTSPLSVAPELCKPSVPKLSLEKLILSPRGEYRLKQLEDKFLSLEKESAAKDNLISSLISRISGLEASLRAQDDATRATVGQMGKIEKRIVKVEGECALAVPIEVITGHLSRSSQAIAKESAELAFELVTAMESGLSRQIQASRDKVDQLDLLVEALRPTSPIIDSLLLPCSSIELDHPVVINDCTISEFMAMAKISKLHVPHMPEPIRPLLRICDGTIGCISSEFDDFQLIVSMFDFQSSVCASIGCGPPSLQASVCTFCASRPQYNDKVCSLELLAKRLDNDVHLHDMFSAQLAQAECKTRVLNEAAESDDEDDNLHICSDSMKFNDKVL